MFKKDTPEECRACEAWKSVNDELRTQIGILNQRISDLQDELFKRDERLATQHSQLIEVFGGRRAAPANGQQQQVIRAAAAPGRTMSPAQWSKKRGELEQESREKIQKYKKLMEEAEAKGTLPKLEE